MAIAHEVTAELVADLPRPEVTSRSVEARTRPTGLYGVPLELPRWRTTMARLLSLAVIGAGIYYLGWRASTLDGTGKLGIAFYATEIANFAFLLVTLAVFWKVRFRRITKLEPFGTLDVFLPVCGEPAELFEGTLRAALAIGYPHETYVLNDGLFAGKANWREIEELAERYGIPCFTRTTGAKGKAANMNAAMARTSGEFIITIDSDHHADRLLADETLGYFHDPDVGLVCSPQEFEGDVSDVLNNRALMFHRYVQCARDAIDSAQSCGNATVYRRSALESIGGFSEWVSVCEDLHSSYRMHAGSWKSVYHNRALTKGLRPQTASAFAKQQLRWATDSLRILIWDNPFTKRGLSNRQRALYVQNTGYYLLNAAQVLFMVSPALWLIWQVPVMTPGSTEEYLAHSLPFLGSIFVLLFLWGGIRGGVRSVQSNLFMAPVFLVALIRAATGVRFPPGVTEKVAQSRFSPLVWPQIALFALLTGSLGYALVNPAPGQAVAAFWAAFMAFSIAGFVTAISVRNSITRPLRFVARSIVVLAAAAIMLPLTGLRGADASAGGPSFAPWSGPKLALAAPTQGAYVGVFKPELPWAPGAVAAWNAEYGATAAIVSWHQPWFGPEARFHRDWAETVDSQGAVPLVVWEPRAGSAARSASLTDIAGGRYDQRIRAFAREVAEFGRPVLLAPLHEPNGSWYAWSTELDGNSARDYRAAWRRVHEIFAAEGAANVRWVWAVYSLSSLGQSSSAIAASFPGRRYVDWTAVAGLNFGTAGTFDAWQSADDILRSTYDELAGYGKPVMILELGTTMAGGDSGAWVRAALTSLRTTYPRVKAVVWYDARYAQGVEFRLTGPAAAAFEAGTAPAYWRAEPRIVAATRRPS